MIIDDALARKLSTSKKGNKLRKAYEENGPMSEEFYFLVHDFAIFIFMRTIGRFDDDMLSEAYLKVLRSLEHFDPTKCNIVSFIFSSIRNEASRAVHYIRKRNHEDDETVLYDKGTECLYHKTMVEVNSMRKQIKAFKFIRYSEYKTRSIIVSVLSGDPTIGGRRVLWDQVKESMR